MNIFLAKSDQDIRRACQVLIELRPHYTLESLIRAVRLQQKAGYQVVMVSENEECLGVAGFIIGHKLAWKKHVYIDDLVVTGNKRSSGVGGALLEWVRQYALEQGCEEIHLDSGVQRFAAHKFYLTHGYHIASHHFSMPVHPPA